MANDNLEKDIQMDASCDDQNLIIAEAYAKIERLTFQNNNYFDQYAASIDEIEKLRSETILLQKQIMELKNRLKDSVYIPCKIGDTIYDTDDNIVEEFKITAIQLDEHDVDIYCKSNIVNMCISPNDFGKRVFKTYSAANRKLKHGSTI